MKTVSRVLNQEKHVRAEVRERVLLAARELNYHPQVTARSLAGRRSYLICMPLTVVSPYAVQAQRGALEACRAAGYHLVVETVDSGAQGALDALMGSLPVDGMLLLPPVCDDLKVLDALEARGVPYVRISPARRSRRGLAIFVDDEGAARIMTEHLLELGHRRIGFVMGPEGHSASPRRLKGFQAALAAHGIAADPELLAPGLFDIDSGREAAERLLAVKDPPTAIFASNDLSAAGVIARAHELGRLAPETLSVAGFDDDLVAIITSPGLTTMRQPIAEMAAAAIGLLVRTAAGDRDAPADAPGFQCSLVIRGSTAPLASKRRGSSGRR